MKRSVLFILIILASIFNHGKSLASKVYSLSPEEHKEHKEIKSRRPLPIYFITTQNLLTIYFEAAIGEVSVTITDKNDKVIYMRQLYIGNPLSLPIELDMSKKGYTLYINNYKLLNYEPMEQQ